jgi:diacylglycerol O-acyltransferase
MELPSGEPDPLGRLQAINRSTAQRRRDEEAERLDDAFSILALTPKPVQRGLAHAFAHPRLFNLTISSVPGPAVTRYLRGCRLRTVHSAVPLSAHHGLSIGVVTVAGNACFGISSDPATVPDADALADHLDAAFDELLDLAADA